MDGRIMRIVGAALILVGVSAAPVSAQAMQDTELLPPNAKAGECYARVFTPPVYETDTDRVLAKEASEQIEVIPARFEWAEERVLVKEASSRLEIVPAKYDWKEEQILVKPASKKLVEVPASYEWAEEKIQIKPAQQVWKKGRGPIEKVDNATGEIMCLVEEPAVYKTVRKRVVKSPATTKEAEIPAEYKTVKKRVIASPPTTRTIEIPAEYQTVRVLKEVEPAKVRKTPVAEEYTTVTKTKMVSDGRLEWQRVLCETNATSDVISGVRQALSRAGHNPGPIDGVLGSQTMRAVRDFQRGAGLPQGYLTHETLEALKVSAVATDPR